MSMRRIATVILLTISLIMSLAITAYADDTNEIKSLDEIVAQPSDSAIQSDETESVNAPGSAEETSKLFNDLGKAADMSEASEEVKKPLSFLQKAVTYVGKFKLCSNIWFNIKSRSGFNIYWFAGLKKNIS